jgi:hypothetical protein
MNTFQTVFEQQKRHFASGVTRTGKTGIVLLKSPV